MRWTEYKARMGEEMHTKSRSESRNGRKYEEYVGAEQKKKKYTNLAWQKQTEGVTSRILDGAEF